MTAKRPYSFVYERDNGSGERVLVRSSNYATWDAAKAAGQAKVESDGWAFPQISDDTLDALEGYEYESGIFLYRVNRAGAVLRRVEKES